MLGPIPFVNLFLSCILQLLISSIVARLVDLFSKIGKLLVEFHSVYCVFKFRTTYELCSSQGSALHFHIRCVRNIPHSIHLLIFKVFG